MNFRGDRMHITSNVVCVCVCAGEESFHWVCKLNSFEEPPRENAKYATALAIAL